MKSVFFISDRTGLTTEALGNTLLTQFSGINIKKYFIPFVDSEVKAAKAIIKINDHYIRFKEKPIVFTSIMNPMIRDKFNLDYVCHIDFVASFLPILEQEFGQKASLAVGMSHGITDETKYYQRIDAIDFVLSNDDGVSTKSYEQADVILIGVSRVSKTPTCLFLAVNYGIKAANYPLAETDLKHEQLPQALLPYHNKLFGLSIEAERLHHIRNNRLPNSEYASLNNCKHEINIAEHIMHNFDIPFLNVSKKSIEEISAAIMQQIRLH